MIKKLKENFLILLISNMLTIIMVVVAPRIHGAIANLMVTVSDSDSGFSLPMIFYYISVPRKVPKKKKIVPRKVPKKARKVPKKKKIVPKKRFCIF